jgi:hypothetical protein
VGLSEAVVDDLLLVRVGQTGEEKWDFGKDHGATCFGCYTR